MRTLYKICIVHASLVPMSSDSATTLLRRLVPVADEHGGLLAAEEAKRAGVSNRMLLHYVSTGDLERVERGVYRMVWFPPHRFLDVIAACLRISGDAVASGETAAAVWGIGDAMPALITICTSKQWRSAIPGVRVRTCRLADDERSVHDAVPVTTLARTLADIAAVDPGRGTALVEDAGRAGLLSEREWRRHSKRYPILAAVEAGRRAHG